MRRPGGAWLLLLQSRVPRLTLSATHEAAARPRASAGLRLVVAPVWPCAARAGAAARQSRVPRLFPVVSTAGGSLDRGPASPRRRPGARAPIGAERSESLPTPRRGRSLSMYYFKLLVVVGGFKFWLSVNLNFLSLHCTHHFR